MKAKRLIYAACVAMVLAGSGTAIRQIRQSDFGDAVCAALTPSSPLWDFLGCQKPVDPKPSM